MGDTSKTDCRHPAEMFAPAIDLLRCKGKEKCTDVRPYSVFEIHKLTSPERLALPFLTRLNSAVHSARQSFATLASECWACGNCVTACLEGDIILVKTT